MATRKRRATTQTVQSAQQSTQQTTPRHPLSASVSLPAEQHALQQSAREAPASPAAPVTPTAAPVRQRIAPGVTVTSTPNAAQRELLARAMANPHRVESGISIDGKTFPRAAVEVVSSRRTRR